MDTNGHGTHVAGTIAAVSNNGIGVAGVMWQAKIMPLKAVGQLFASIQAIDYAWMHGAKISNNSWGCSDAFGDIFLCNDLNLRDAIKRAENAGHLFVAAAGNSNRNVDGGTFEQTACLNDPVTNPCNIIGVAASDRVADPRDGQDSKWPSSNYGPKTIHIGAPGVSILSTVPNGGYTNLSGTSMAAPHVTGTAGLIWAQNPSYSYPNVKESVLLAHRPVVAFYNPIPGTPDWPTIYGGITNANDAIRAFGDTFDDTQGGLRFFSQGGTGQRWAVAQNGSARCDLLVQNLGIVDEMFQVQYLDQAGLPGSNWTNASYKASYPPDGLPAEIKIRVRTVDGSSWVGKTGRIAVGFIGQTGLTNLTCPQTGLSYSQHSYTASIHGGVQLEDRRPFWITDPTYFEQTYAPVDNIQFAPALTISMKFTSQDFTLTIRRSDNGAQLFSATSTYPPSFTWSGTHAPIIVYYGVTPGASGSLYVQDFVSIRPSGTPASGPVFPGARK